MKVETDKLKAHKKISHDKEKLQTALKPVFEALDEYFGKLYLAITSYDAFGDFKFNVPLPYLVHTKRLYIFYVLTSLHTHSISIKYTTS